MFILLSESAGDENALMGAVGGPKIVSQYDDCDDWDKGMFLLVYRMALAILEYAYQPRPRGFLLSLQLCFYF